MEEMVSSFNESHILAGDNSIKMDRGQPSGFRLCAILNTLTMLCVLLGICKELGLKNISWAAITGDDVAACSTDGKQLLLLFERMRQIGVASPSKGGLSRNCIGVP